MEEIKNNRNDEVIEQRPSTKYGRTAYQEQLRREQQENGGAQAYNNNSNYSQYEFEQNHAYQSLYTKHQSYETYQEEKAEVKNLYAYILMVLVACSAIINCVVSMMTMDAFNQLETVDINAVLDLLVTSTGFTMLSYVGDMFFWVSVVIFVLDIMAIHKAGKKIRGAILFAIFLRPLYFIWRAHILGRKKIAPIIYAVCYYGFCIFEYVTIFMMAFEVASKMV